MKNFLKTFLFTLIMICLSGCRQDESEQISPVNTETKTQTIITETAQVTETPMPTLTQTQTPTLTKTPTPTITPTTTLVASYYDQLPLGEYLILKKWNEDDGSNANGVFAFNRNTEEVWKFSDYLHVPDSSNGRYFYQKTENEFFIWDMVNDVKVSTEIDCSFITIDNNLNYGAGFCMFDGEVETGVVDFTKNEFIILDENLDGDPYFYPPQISPDGKYIIARKMCYWDCKGIGNYYVNVDCMVLGKTFEECSKKLFMPITNYYSDSHIVDWSPDSKLVAGIIGNTNIVKIFDPHNNYALMQFEHREDLTDVFWSQCNEGLYLMETWTNNVVYYDLNTKTFEDINLEDEFFMRGVFCKE